jgi:hypothetical protein
MKIIYPYNGTIAVINPAGLPLADCCEKDVPYNVPYLIVQDSEIPTDRMFRDAWTEDFTTPDGYGMGAQRWFIREYDRETQNLQAEIDALPAYLSQQADVRDAAIANALAVFLIDEDAAKRDEAIVIAHAAYREQEELTQILIASHQSRMAELAVMRKTQTDELFKLEGVQLDYC